MEMLLILSFCSSSDRSAANLQEKNEIKTITKRWRSGGAAITIDRENSKLIDCNYTETNQRREKKKEIALNKF